MRMSRRLTLAICLLALAMLGREAMAQGPPPGMPPASMRPYPANSMYDFEYDKHYYRDGMWNRVSSNRGRRSIFNIDYLMARTRTPTGAPIRQGHHTAAPDAPRPRPDHRADPA